MEKLPRDKGEFFPSTGTGVEARARCVQVDSLVRGVRADCRLRSRAGARTLHGSLAVFKVSAHFPSPGPDWRRITPMLQLCAATSKGHEPAHENTLTAFATWLSALALILPYRWRQAGRRSVVPKTFVNKITSVSKCIGARRAGAQAKKPSRRATLRLDPRWGQFVPSSDALSKFRSSRNFRYLRSGCPSHTDPSR